MPFLLTPADVRIVLDPSMTAADLPDAVITSAIFASTVDATILARDPLAGGYTGAPLAQVQQAAAYLTAALIAPSLPRFVSEQWGATDYKYQLQPRDWVAVAAELRARADILLDLATGVNPDDALIAEVPAHLFGLASPACPPPIPLRRWWP